MTAPPSRHSPLARMAEGYWVESRRPLASLVFIAPWLVVYEAGVLLLGPTEVRNGADALLRDVLGRLGFGQYFLLPVLTACVLLGWHYTTRQTWRLSRGLLWGMGGECLLLSICLWLLAQVQGLVLQIPPVPTGSVAQDAFRTVGRAVSFLGAGIYEELLFRLILLSAVVWGLTRLKLKPRSRTIVAVLLTSLLFAGAHYVGEHGDLLNWYSFLFRFLAGTFFAVLFLYRGFGIAAGAHAGYDMLAGLFPN
ncbi:MAG: CPBP family intramembrane metalloprotease [Pirellulales bacterium]|nr:CPBP family intramembrane metalloprotease [Pirellulales bacterium]